MSVIEGVGDEVTVVIGLLTVFFIGFITYAYRSLNIYNPSSIFSLFWEQYGSRLLEINLFHTFYVTLNPTPQARVASEQRALNGSTRNSQPENRTQLNETPSETAELSNNVEGAGDATISESAPSSSSIDSDVMESENVIENEDRENDTIHEEIQQNEHNERQQNETEQSESPPIQSNSANIETTTSSDIIQVRLKYLNDAEQVVTTRVTETVGAFKRAHFAADLNDNMTVRLIFNGQLLNDRMTLQSYRIEDRTVLHVLVSHAQPQVQQSTTQTDLDISGLMWPLFSLMLVLCWIVYIRYPEFFSVTSIILLVAFSASFLVVYVHSQVQVP